MTDLSELQSNETPVLVEIKASVNGRKVSRSVPIHYRVIDFVREELKLTGNKEGCGAGECGTCSMFIDGELMKSCLMPVHKINNKRLETVESLDANGDLSVVQKAFHKCGSSQCGYCIPGMVMASTALLRANSNPTIDQIREGLGGNICRCTGYQKITDAVELARDVLNGARPMSDLEEEPASSFMGHSTRRLDAPGKVSGATKYAADLWAPNMLHLAVVRSPHSYARINRIDSSAALSMEGVEAVITSDDIPGIDNFGVFIEDQPVMARGVVRYIGEAVAAVAAETPELARKAAQKISIHYEPIAGVFDPFEAIKDGAPQLHEFAKNNICKHTKIRKGDVERVLKEAPIIVCEQYKTAALEHAYLEPEAGLSYLESDGTVTVVSPSQNLTHHRHMLAKIIAKPIHKVRMIMSTVGGGFGGKEDMIYQGMLALMAMKTRRPVRYVFTREESFVTTAKRHPFTIDYTMGLSREGKILASKMEMIADGGAYAMSSPGVMNKAAILGPGPYAIPNVWVDAIAVYTNNTPRGAFRSFGAFQSEFATESHLDICAARLGLDPVDIRRINLMQDSAVTHTGQKLDQVLAMRCLDALIERAGWDQGRSFRHGQGGSLRGDLGQAEGVRTPCTLGSNL